MMIKTKNRLINESSFEQKLYTSKIPDPDILIRTGGTKRLSNFLLWQLAYTEIFFLNKLWPDFNEKDFYKMYKAGMEIKSSNLKPINFPKKEVISTLDELPIMMTIASQIKGISSFNHIGVIRGKESDRIKKMSENLKAFGIKTSVTKNSIKVYGSSLKIHSKNKIIKIKTSLDHRIQMCSVILAALTSATVIVQGCSTIKTSFPNFFLLLEKIGLKVKYEIQKK